jgi:FkbM family methyltransferase
MFRFFSKLTSSLEGVDRKLMTLNLHFEAVTSQLAAMNLRIGALERDINAPLPADVGALYQKGLHAVGVLNYENDVVSGERRFLTRYLEQYPDAVILDVGANAGQYAELARELGSKAVIHSFEPHPGSFDKLSELAGPLNIKAHALALGDARSEIEFFDYAEDAGSQHASVYRDVIEIVHRRPAAAIKVRCETLDHIVGELGIEKIGLLKIDTEGHEFSVLKGARGLLDAGLIDVIQFEFNEMNVISRVFMKDFFTILPNYRIYRLLSNGVIEFQTYDPTFMEVFAYQNIICIRKDIDPFWIHAK